MSSEILVSVIIPCYNSAETIKRAVISALNQRCVKEVIVSDDGSSDQSESVTCSIGDRVRFITGPNGGAPSARNRGAMSATSPFLLFLDSDDYIDDGYIDALAINATASTDVVLGPYRRVSTNGTVFDETVYSQGLTATEALAEYLNNPTQTGAFLWRREFLSEIGGWDEGLAIYQDAELTIRALLKANHVEILSTTSVFAYWLDNDTNQRLSNRFSAIKARSTLIALNRHRDSIEKTKSKRAVHGIASRYYSLARLSFKNGHSIIGKEALAQYRNLGYLGHEGTTAHRLSCLILGLEQKTIALDAISRFKSRFIR